MSRDRREEILARLVDLLKLLPGPQKVYRNRSQLSASQRPAIVVLDGDESGTVRDFALGRPLSSPNIMRMSPQICLMAAGGPDVVGTVLNTLRLIVIPAVLSDGPLSDFVGTTGGIQYQGCTTDLARGRTIEGEMILNFEIHYALKPVEMT